MSTGTCIVSETLALIHHSPCSQESPVKNTPQTTRNPSKVFKRIIETIPTDKEFDELRQILTEKKYMLDLVYDYKPPELMKGYWYELMNLLTLFILPWQDQPFEQRIRKIMSGMDVSTEDFC